MFYYLFLLFIFHCLSLTVFKHMFSVLIVHYWVYFIFLFFLFFIIIISAAGRLIFLIAINRENPTINRRLIDD